MEDFLSIDQCKSTNQQILMMKVLDNKSRDETRDNKSGDESIDDQEVDLSNEYSDDSSSDSSDFISRYNHICNDEHKVKEEHAVSNKRYNVRTVDSDYLISLD